MAQYVWGQFGAILQFRTLSIPDFPCAGLDTGKRCCRLLWAARLSWLCCLLCLCRSRREGSRLLLSLRWNSDSHGGGWQQPAQQYTSSPRLLVPAPSLLPFSLFWGKSCPRCPLPGRESPLCQQDCDPLGWIWLWVSLHCAGWKAPKKQFKDPVNNPQTNKSALLVSTMFLSSVSPFSIIRK